MCSELAKSLYHFQLAVPPSLVPLSYTSQNFPPAVKLLLLGTFSPRYLLSALITLAWLFSSIPFYFFATTS